MSLTKEEMLELAKEFERWFKMKFPKEALLHSANGGYQCLPAYIAWESYKASASAIEQKVEQKYQAEINRLKQQVSDSTTMWTEQCAENAKFQQKIAMLSEDSKRYQRLRIIGVAPYETKHLSNGTVLRFQNLDGYCDAEIKAHPSRGEATQQSAEAREREVKAGALEEMPEGWAEAVNLAYNIHTDLVAPENVSKKGIKELAAAIMSMDAKAAELRNQAQVNEPRKPCTCDGRCDGFCLEGNP